MTLGITGILLIIGFWAASLVLFNRRLHTAVEERTDELARTNRELERLATAIAQADEIVLITDTEGSIQYVNPAFTAITGYSENEVLEKTPAILKSGKHGKNFYRTIWQTIEKGEVWRDDIINRKKDGSLFHAEVTISPIRDENKKTVNYVAVYRDVTMERKLQEQLRQAQKMEAIGTLAGGIAHDFNNILTIILGNSQILQKNNTGSDKTSRRLNEIFSAALRAKDLVSQILTFSRKTEAEKKAVNISPLLKETIKILSASLPSTIEINHLLNAEHDLITADPTQIHQVIMNLCTNSLQAMKNRQGILSLTLENIELSPDDLSVKLPPDDYLKLSVIDTGCGMNRETLDRIFEPYFTTKEIGEGTGLGLATVHGIVTDHGGAISAYSEPDKGTTFNIYFPLASENGRAEGILFRESLPHGDETILFIDDENSIIEIASELLNEMGYTVKSFNNGREAMDYCASQPENFNIIITDKTMPGMTGFDLACEARKIRADIPVILTTGFTEEADIQLAASCGIADIVSKPIMRNTIARVLRKVLDDHGK